MSAFSSIRREQRRAAPKTYAQELGWVPRQTGDGTVYTGDFRAGGLHFDGWVLRQNSGKLLFYIFRPPTKWLRDTEFANCFHPANGDWWLVAFRPYDLPSDVPSGIAAIQNALFKAFQAQAGKRRSQW